MNRAEIVARAIEFRRPPRLPFFVGSAWKEKMERHFSDFPHDVCDSWEMDRQKTGWFFDNAVPDDWGCVWKRTHLNNMGQVVGHPLEDWSALDSYLPPNPADPFYFERTEAEIADAEDRYVVITSHFNLIERLEMLHGFSRTLEDFYMEPERVHRVLDMILDYKVRHLSEAARRFGDRVHGVFLTDDWGTQQNTYISEELFREFFFHRYKVLFDSIHDHGWHVILHSCGRINDFVPVFIELGVDVMNMQQPRAYGIEEIGRRFAGKIAFLATVDIQSTLPNGVRSEVEVEARDLVENWSTPEGGFIVFNYGDSEGIGTTDEITEAMFSTFYGLRHRWNGRS